MVLLIGQGTTYRPINDGEIEDPELIYTAFNEYASDSQQLVKVSSEKKVVKNYWNLKLPETRLGAPGVLYVNQREFAATVPEDEMTKYIGTDRF